MCETDFYKFRKIIQNLSINKIDFIKEWEYIGSKYSNENNFLKYNLKKYKIKNLPVKKRFICEHEEHDKYYIRNFFNGIILVTGVKCCSKIGIQTIDYNICKKCKKPILELENKEILCYNCQQNCIRCKILKQDGNIMFCNTCLKEVNDIHEIRLIKKVF